MTVIVTEKCNLSTFFQEKGQKTENSGILFCSAHKHIHTHTHTHTHLHIHTHTHKHTPHTHTHKHTQTIFFNLWPVLRTLILDVQPILSSLKF